MPNIVILTGAGISAESGIRTFRDADGLWEGHKVEAVATPEGFAADPSLVYRFYNERRRSLGAARPNAAHEALVTLERTWSGEFLLVTQNVDDLHERAGAKRLLHMHGELTKARCLRSGEIFSWPDDLDFASRCRCCGVEGRLRPHIVWFGEVPFGLDETYEALERADFFISIGTSGLVYPAAGFVSATAPACRRIEINTKDTDISAAFQEHRTGAAGKEVPQLVKELLAALN